MPSLTETTPTRTFRYSAALDNHSPTRDYAYGAGEYYAPGTAWQGQSESIVLVDALNRFSPNSQPHINFIVDDGESVRAFYVVAWHEERNRLIIHPFPTNTGAIRPDNGRPVDYSNWSLGPRKTFHLKVTWQGEAPKPTYEQKEIDKVPADAYQLTLKVWGSSEDGMTRGESHHLNITPAQLSAIRAILGSEA